MVTTEPVFIPFRYWSSRLVSQILGNASRAFIVAGTDLPSRHANANRNEGLYQKPGSKLRTGPAFPGTRRRVDLAQARTYVGGPKVSIECVASGLLRGAFNERQVGSISPLIGLILARFRASEGGGRVAVGSQRPAGLLWRRAVPECRRCDGARQT